MATELSSSFLCQGWMRRLDCKQLSVRLYPVPSRRFVIMRQSNSGSEQKRSYTKKIFRRKPPKNVPSGPSVAEESDSEGYNTDDISITNLEPMSRNSVETNGAALNADDNNSSMNLETMVSNSVETNGAVENASDSNSGKLVLSKQNQSTSLNADGREVNSNVHIQDLIAMIRHAEKTYMSKCKSMQSPVKDLIGGLAAMVGVGVLALFMLACTYWKHKQWDQGGEGRELSSIGENEGAPIFVIMPGPEISTYLAIPTPVPSTTSW